MARVTLSAGRSRPVPRRRGDAVRAALTAAGVSPPPMLATYDMTRGTPSEKFYLDRVLESSYADLACDRWPCESAGLAVDGSLFRDGSSVVYRTDDGVLIYASLSYGWMHLDVAAPDRRLIGPTFAAFRAAYPASYLTQTEDPRVPITFWANSKFGPTARLRKVDSALWEAITGNYTSAVEEQLAALMGWENGPPSKDGGQLILWQGPPGTGKSWALRALASEWSPWAEFHYITDPDSFFVDDPSYMIEVLLADSYAAIDEPTGDVYAEQRDEKWRILILEDTGELLSATAKEKYGQGLSRLLNVVDGMIGQGLRVLALVTTNDELGDLHPAVVRPGRCASQIAFGPLTDDEARAWTGDPDAAGGTLAELFSRYGRATAEAIPAGGEEFAVADTVAAIRRVAEEHQPEGGYGETAWNPGDRAVYWVCGDWTSNEEAEAAEAAFLAIDGVDSYDYEAEAALPSGDGWEQVWPAPDEAAELTASGDEEAAILADLVELASRPL